MQKYSKDTIKRTQRVIFLDKLVSPSNFKQAIKLEIFAALSAFMDISEEDIKLIITLDKTGKYRFDFSVQTNNVKPVNISLN